MEIWPNPGSQETALLLFRFLSFAVGLFLPRFEFPHQITCELSRMVSYLFKRLNLNRLVINPQTATSLRAYLECAVHGDDMNGAMFWAAQAQRQDQPGAPGYWTRTRSIEWCA